MAHADEPTDIYDANTLVTEIAPDIWAETEPISEAPVSVTSSDDVAPVVTVDPELGNSKDKGGEEGLETSPPLNIELKYLEAAVSTVDDVGVWSTNSAAVAAYIQPT